MSKTPSRKSRVVVPARYMVMYGLRGCYMPDSSYPIEATSLRDFANEVRSAIDLYGLPKTYIRKVRVRAIWRAIQRAGSSSSVHFSLDGSVGHALEFAGLTDSEYEQHYTYDR